MTVPNKFPLVSKMRGVRVTAPRRDEGGKQPTPEPPGANPITQNQPAAVSCSGVTPPSALAGLPLLRASSPTNKAAIISPDSFLIGISSVLLSVELRCRVETSQHQQGTLPPF